MKAPPGVQVVRYGLTTSLRGLRRARMNSRETNLSGIGICLQKIARYSSKYVACLVKPKPSGINRSLSLDESARAYTEPRIAPDGRFLRERTGSTWGSRNSD
jgi:hypothetical protein